ncbi:tRNA3(Ser)-specific nuclease WapA precursor [Phycisphaerae bacterium RAS1]|nr:tRNA3(Ser)-specific nuclease WapA precursor [Phycisphaerae bacterium RAS1]
MPAANIARLAAHSALLLSLTTGLAARPTAAQQCLPTCQEETTHDPSCGRPHPVEECLHLVIEPMEVSLSPAIATACVGDTVTITATWLDGDSCHTCDDPDWCYPPNDPRYFCCSDDIQCRTMEGVTYKWSIQSDGTFECCKFTSANPHIDTIQITGTQSSRVVVQCTINDLPCDECSGAFDDPPERLYAVIDFGCALPPNITFDTDELCPDGRSTTTASVLFSNCPGAYSIDWSIKGDAVFDPPNPDGFATATIRAGVHGGLVEVEAVRTDTLACVARGVLTVGCASCASGECGPGQGTASLAEQPTLAFPMGKSWSEQSAGRLYVDLDELSRSSPLSLRFSGSTGSVSNERHAVYDPAGILRQVKTRECLADIRFGGNPAAPSAAHAGYEIWFFRPPASGVWPDANQDGIYDVASATPFAKWRVDSGDPPESAVVRVARIDGDTKYEFSNSVGAAAWTLATYEADELLRTDTLSPELDGSLQRESRDAAGRLLKRTKTYYGTYGWLERREYTDETQFQTWFREYESAPQQPWLLKVERVPNGAWTFYTYDADSRVLWQGGPSSGYPSCPTVPNTSQGRWTHYSYDQLSGDSGDDDNMPRTTSTYVDGTWIAKTYQYTQLAGTELTFIREECLSESASVSSPTNLTTRTTYRDYGNRVLKSLAFPDGRVDRHEYDTPDWALKHVWHLYASGGSELAADGKSTVEAITRDDNGRTTLTQLWLAPLFGTQLTNELSSTSYDYDSVTGRLTDVAHSNGTHANTVWSGCCGTRTHTSELGLKETTEHDIFGRQVLHRLHGYDGTPDVDTVFDYSQFVDGFSAVVTTRSGAVTNLTSLSTTDLSGRVKKHVSENGVTTDYFYDTLPAGGVAVTALRSDGSGEKTEYFADGRVHKVLSRNSDGSYRLDRQYEYGVEALPGTDCTYTREFDGPLGGTSPRWRTTYYDACGRVRREARPSADGSSAEIVTDYYYYTDNEGFGVGQGRAARGKLRRVVRPGQADLVYVYDELADVFRTGLDCDGVAGLQRASAHDRITETETKFDGDWRKTTTTQYLSSGSSDSTVIGIRRERVKNWLEPNLVRETEEVSVFGTGGTTIAKQYKVADAPVVNDVVDYPDAATNAVQVTENGLLKSTTSKSGVTQTFEYDDLRRRKSSADSRTNWATFTAYNGADVDAVYTTVDNQPGGTRLTDTVYEYDPTTKRLSATKQLDTSVQPAAYRYTRYEYASRGQVKRMWGDIPQPVEFSYDEFDQRTSLTTFRGDAAWSGATWPSGVSGDTTTWILDDASGVLLRKEYADGEGTDFTYLADGRLKIRTWARGVTTTYTYFGESGAPAGDGNELWKTDYSDATPDVTNVRDRAGRLLSSSQTGGPTHSFDYSAWPGIVKEVISGGPFTRDYVITRQTPENEFGKLNATKVGTTGDESADYSASYLYDASTGRMNRITGPGLPAQNGGAFYSYVAGSDLVGTLEVRDTNGTTVKQRTTRQYETPRDLIDYIENRWQPAGANVLVSKYDYVNDSLGRRTDVVHTGTAFSAGARSAWAYNDRHELVGQDRFANTTIGDSSNPVDEEFFDYDYDPIGSRETASKGQQTPAMVTYARNNLNQYVQIDSAQAAPRKNFTHDADGNLSGEWLTGDMNCDGVVDILDLNAFVLAILDPAAYAAQYPNCNLTSGDINGDGLVNVLDINPFNDLLGLKDAPTGLNIRYVWDGENRLIEARPADDAAIPSGTLRSFYRYDYAGQRIEKEVKTYDGSSWGTSPVTTRTRYVHDGWLLLLELDGLASNAIARKYTWGLDLAGLNGSENDRTSAGGIGGLLAMEQASGVQSGYSGGYLYCYDANGNVTQVLDADDGSSAVRYEYDPYGNRVNASASPELDQPFRFSTRPFDTETGFGSWPFRYYDPRTGRWLSRDPHHEHGGANLYRDVENSPTDLIDPLGLEAIEVEFNAFIPGRLGTWLPEPGGAFELAEGGVFFKTDERSFGGGASRLFTRVTIDSDSIGAAACKKSGPTIVTDTGTSHRKITRRLTTGYGHEWDTTYYEKKAVQTSSSSTFQGKCSTIVCVTAAASYPFSIVAPNIDYSICWRFTVAARNTVTVYVWGSHDKFPNYEALINRPASLGQYRYDTPGKGPGFSNLWLAGPVRFQGSGYSILVDNTPECCPE